MSRWNNLLWLYGNKCGKKMHVGDKIVLSVSRLKVVESSYVKAILGVEKIM